MPVDITIGLFLRAVYSSSGKLVKSADAILKNGTPSLSRKSMESSSQPEMGRGRDVGIRGRRGG
jgi:hypothetical protein